GLQILGAQEPFHRVYGQVSTVKSMPSWLDFLHDVPGMGWLMDTRLAWRLYGGAALPNDARLFTLGGSQMLRGFDLNQRQGSLAGIASVEWRVPILKDIEWDCCDHVAGLRNLYMALFYDVGDMYDHGHSLGPVAHSVGVGLRFDTAWFGM